MANSPPGPQGHWLLGNLPEFRREKLDFYTRCARDHGDVACFRLGPKRLVLLSHPDYVEQVLVTDNRNFVKHYVLQLLRPVLGNGLLLSEGEYWLRQRRLMQPAFQRQRIEALGPIMVAHAERLLASWRGGSSRDVRADMMCLTLHIVAQTLLGADVSAAANAVGEAIDLLMTDFSYRFESAFALPKWLPTPWNLRVRRQRQRLKALILDLIRQHRQEARARSDFLSQLVQARDQDDGVAMTDAQLRDELMTLFLAGHETTANALTWTWYLLAQNPEVAGKLRAELRTVLADRSPTVADLPRLVFTERVILESLRLYPPVYAFGRMAVHDCTIGGFHIPAGMTVLMSQWVLHRDPRFFERPECFLPDRWADGLARRLPKYAYFPFGGGPRLCIGNSFAIVEAVLVLATLASRFHLRLAPGQTVAPWPSVTLRPAKELRMEVVSMSDVSSLA